MEWSKRLYQQYISTPLVQPLKKHDVSPNQLTILNHIITLTLGVYFFSRGLWWGFLCGLGIMLINGILDYADGDLAKKNNRVTAVGDWLDSAFDVVILSCILAAIAVGCFKQGLPLSVIMLFFIGNTALNLVSFHYNKTFGFDSASGSELFRIYIDKKATWFNRLMKNIIDPTSSAVGLFMYTLRYWIVIGAILNLMPITFVIFTAICNVRWIIMYALYALHLMESRKLWVSQTLAILDPNRKEYHALRNSEKV